jgi:hypothetical protein
MANSDNQQLVVAGRKVPLMALLPQLSPFLYSCNRGRHPSIYPRSLSFIAENTYLLPPPVIFKCLVIFSKRFVKQRPCFTLDATRGFLPDTHRILLAGSGQFLELMRVYVPIVCIVFASIKLL